jgi:preprotein translocase subunit SecE
MRSFASLRMTEANRGVSSTVKLSVSKTELGGSNPSAPARVEVRSSGPRGSSRGKREGMATAVEQNAVVTTLRSWPERVKSFYSDVRTEMKKVTSPSRKEVQGTTTVVIITVFLFAFYFWLVDLAISNSLERMLHYFSRH